MKPTERVENFHTTPKGFRQLFSNYYVTCFYRKNPGRSRNHTLNLPLSLQKPPANHFLSLRRHRLHDGASVHRRGLPAPPQGPAGDGQHPLHHRRAVHCQPRGRRLQLPAARRVEVGLPRSTQRSCRRTRQQIGTLRAHCEEVIDGQISLISSGSYHIKCQKKSDWLKRLMEMSVRAQVSC